MAGVWNGYRFACVLRVDVEHREAERYTGDPRVERVATGDANAGRTRMIWGVLTAALWIGRHEHPARFGRN